jgi:hypothetical protein
MSPKPASSLKRESDKDSPSPSKNIDSTVFSEAAKRVQITTASGGKLKSDEKRSAFLQAAELYPEIFDDDVLISRGQKGDPSDDLKLPSLPKRSSPESPLKETCADVDKKKLLPFFESINPLSSVIVKVLFNDKKVFGFPIIFRQFLKDDTSFISFDDLHEMIAQRADNALLSRRCVPIFKTTKEIDYGRNLDLRIDSLDADLGEFHISPLYYVESICASYHQHGKIVLNLHCPRCPFYDEDPKIASFVTDLKVPPMFTPTGDHHDKDSTKEEPMLQDFAGGTTPKGMKGMRRSDLQFGSHRFVRNDIAMNTPNNSSRRNLTTSPIMVYDDDDYLVKDPTLIVAFAQESIQSRVADLQATAAITVPDVSAIPKLLKSHNVAYKDGDNATTWYQRFNNFCMMIGIYVPPPKSMEKNSEMGREWDSQALPHVFYHRFSHMEKVLMHILFSPDFFPKSLQDDLQLNPKPYNFLRLFMALHSHSVPELSDRVIKRPGPMKVSQSLSQYALTWVNYFTDESAVNGVVYSKFRQYCYFVDGLPQRFSVLRKFLEMEFVPPYDKFNNIPISLELRNLPATISSLANIHGVTVSGNQPSAVHQVDDTPAAVNGSDDNVQHDTDDCRIKALTNRPPKPRPINQQSSLRSTKAKMESKVVCWLCDGPHSFRQCKELDRMKSVCIQRPNVMRHFQQLLLKKDGEGIKVLMDAPEFFDEGPIEVPNATDDHDTPVENGDMDDQHIKSIALTGDSVESAGIDDCDEPSPFFILAIHEDESIPAGFDDHGDTRLYNDVGIERIKSLTFSDSSPCVKLLGSPHMVQVDGGADRSTTPHRELVHDFRPPDESLGEKTSINDAGVHSHRIIGYGHFKVRCFDKFSNPVIIKVPCACIPSIPSTLLNFRNMPNLLHLEETSSVLLDAAQAILLVTDRNDNPCELRVPLLLRGTRLYVNTLIAARNDSSFAQRHLNDRLCILSTPKHINEPASINIVSDEPSKLLWHGRLGHLNFRALADMHKFATGIPKFKQSHVFDNCASCLVSKLRRSPRGHGKIGADATVHGQVLCADWGFVCQNSPDTDRVSRLTSVYGDTSYLIFTCVRTGALYGVCAGSKSVPTKWLHIFLHRMSRGINDYTKNIIVDRGSELGRSIEFKKIAETHGYLLNTSGPDKSSMNGLGERPHSTIGDALRTILYSSGLELKYWNFAFYHFIRLYNLVPHGDRTASPFELVRGRQPDLSKLRIFGSHVYIRPPGRRSSKLEPHAILGRFLGYTSTLKQIYYLENTTNKIKIAAHARFDEGMSAAPLDELPPFAIQLRRALGQAVPSPEVHDIGTPNDIDLMASPSQFPVTFTHQFRIKLSDISNEYDTLGFILQDDPILRRCFVKNVLPRSTASTYPRWRTQLIGCFILCIDDDIIVDSASAHAIFGRYLVDASDCSVPPSLSITFASDKSLLRRHDPDVEPAPIQLDQICHISSLADTGEEVKYQARIDFDWIAYFDDLVNCPTSCSLPIDDDAIHKVSTSQFTRRQLMSRPDFHEWQQAEFKQLDTHASDNMFGKSCPRPTFAIVLRSIWSYCLKWNGDKKARHCCDGRPLRDDRYRRIEAIYTACISQVGMKIFFSLCALENYVIIDLDAVNAFGQAGSLYDIIYLEIDQQYRDWYKSRHNIDIPIGHVLPVRGLLQGHPDSGEIWQTKVNRILDKYNFTTTTHEPCLYRGTFNNKPILLCRQVDDMLLAGEDIPSVQAFAKELSKHLKITFGTTPSEHFNGLDILQTADAIKLSCWTYIRKLKDAHGWNEKSSKFLEPIGPSMVRELESTVGPPVDSAAGKLLQKKNGFNYRGVVGEIVYAYIICRPDYGFAVALLSRFNTCPAQCHYDAAKRCLKSLIRNDEDGIWYWRRTTRTDLPPTQHTPRIMEDFEKKFPILENPFLVSSIADVSLAPGILMRRSFGATFVYLANVALVLYLAKLQASVSTSSGEGEFIQFVLSGKKVKYVRTVMEELGYPQSNPSPIFGDNISSIMMANNVRPTDRTRHMDIRYFALQEWIHVDKDIILIHIPTILNSADALTKALAWIKHHRHMSRAMGHLGSPFHPDRYKLVPVTNDSIKALYLVPT